MSEDIAINPAELAYAIRVDEAEVIQRRYRPLGPGQVLFHGVEVNVRRVETGRRRFSPAVFQRESSKHPHVHKAAWELRDIPFCFEGWDMLQDTCWCEKGGVVQRWSRTGTRVEECDRCGDPLARIEPIPVPERMRPALRVAQAVMSPIAEQRAAALDALPEPLRATNRSALFRAIIRLANAIVPGAAEVSFEEPEVRLAGLHAACAALRDWPQGLSHVELPADTPNTTWELIRAGWNKLPGEGPRRSSPRAQDGAARVRRAPGPKTGNGPVGIRRGTEIAHLSPEVLLGAWEHRLVTRHQRLHGARLLPAFDPHELVTLGKAWRERRKADSLAAETGFPIYAIEQIAALGCVVADALAIPGTGPHFTPDRVADFHRAMEDGCTRIQDAVPLKRAMRLVGGRLKPWGLAVQMLLQGEAPYYLEPGRLLADRIVIGKRDIERVASLVDHMPVASAFGFSDLMPQTDALEVLNATADASHLLRSFRQRGASRNCMRSRTSRGWQRRS